MVERADNNDRISLATRNLIDKLNLEHHVLINTQNTISVLKNTRKYDDNIPLNQKLKNGIIDTCELSVAIFYLNHIVQNRQDFEGISDETLIKALCKHASVQEYFLKNNAYDFLNSKPKIAREYLQKAEVYAELQKRLISKPSDLNEHN